MKKSVMRVLCTVWAAMLLVSVLPIGALAANVIGGNTTDGYDILYYDDGTLHIGYTGEYEKASLSEGRIQTSDGYVNVTNVYFAEGFTAIYSKNAASRRFYDEEPCTVHLPGSVKTIESSAFSGCSMITSINLGGVEAIGSSAFSGTGLTYVSTDATIGKGAFQNCTQLVSASLGGESIGSEAFEGCTALTSVSLSSNLTSLGDSIFDGCVSLKSVSIPKNVVSIGTNCFYGSSLSSVSLPNGIVSIGSGAFLETNLTSVTLPESFTWYSGNGMIFPEGSDFTVYGYRGTSAQRYAEYYNNTFIPLDGCGLSVEVEDADIISRDVYAGTVMNDDASAAEDGFSVQLTLVQENDAFDDIQLDLTLPEGFSFSPDELVQEKTLDVGSLSFPEEENARTKVWSPTIYPIYLDRVSHGDDFELKAQIRALDSVGESVQGGNTTVFFESAEVLNVAVDTREDGGTYLESYEFDLGSATGSGSKYNQDTANLSVLMSDLAYTPDEMVRFLTNLGFLSIEQYEVDDNNENECGRYIAHKRIIENGKIKNLVYVICRGTASNREWMGNLHIDDMAGGEYHEGFWAAGKAVKLNLENYWVDHGFKKESTILLIAGHSKGAAAANVAGHLINSEGVLAEYENTNVYTFATPTVNRAAVDEDVAMNGDGNIYNFVHYQDVIRNAPSMQFYGRFGNTKFFGYGDPESGVKSANFGYGTYPCTGGSENYTVNEILNGIMYSIDAGGKSNGALVFRYLLPALSYISQHTGHTVWEIGNALIGAHGFNLNMNPYYDFIQSGQGEISASAIRQRTEAAYRYYLNEILTLEESFVWQSFACPVNVYVDRADGNTVAKLENGVAESNSEDIWVYYNGEAKVVGIARKNIGAYTIRVVAYDNGSVSHTVRYMDADAGESLDHCASVPVSNRQVIILSADGRIDGQTYRTFSGETLDEGYLVYGNELVSPVTCPMYGYTDLDINAWYHDGVHFCIEHGLMQGIGNNQFSPNGTTTRAMIVTILWRLEGSPVVNYAMDFEDVAANQWYTEAIRWAASKKIVEGYGNGKFGTNDAITREQMVTIMFRYAKYKGYDVSDGANTSLLSYGDAYDVADWAIPALQWACGESLIKGIADGSKMNLAPQGNATRAQAATILQRYIENVVKVK